MAVVTTGTVYEGASATLLARVTDANNAPVLQASLSSINYEIWDITIPGLPEKILSSTAITIATSIFDTLQTGGPWTVDDIGYNFRYELASTDITLGATTQFPNARIVATEVKFTPTSGADRYHRWELRVLPRLFGK